MTIRPTNWAALLISLLVLVAGAGALVLNPVGLTATIHSFEFQGIQRLFPAVSGASPAAPLIATTNINIGTPPWQGNAAALWPQLFFVLVAGLTIVALLSRGRYMLAAFFTLLVIAAAIGVDWLLFTRAHLFVPVLAACFVLVLVWAIGFLAAGLQPARREGANRVSPDRPYAAEIATESPARTAKLPEAKGERRTVTYLACRIGGLSELVGALEPGGVAGLTQGIVEPAIEVVAACGGTLISANGGRLAAVWISSDGSDQVTQACDAALRMSAAVTQVQDQHGEGTPYERLLMGIGMATGAAVVIGNGGNRDHAAVVGDCVERADELSLLGRRYGPTILIDAATRDAVEPNFATLEIDAVALSAGGATKIYALYGNPLVRASPKFRALSTFHDHLFQAIREQRWADARALIEQCGKLSGAIPTLYDLHLARIGWYESHPPPKEWDGAFEPPIL
jgi:adenylate cyclase